MKLQVARLIVHHQVSGNHMAQNITKKTEEKYNINYLNVKNVSVVNYCIKEEKNPVSNFYGHSFLNLTFTNLINSSPKVYSFVVLGFIDSM